MRLRVCLVLTCLCGLGQGAIAARASERFLPVGCARVDIAPSYPIRLCGYAVRKRESEGVAQRLWAKALAFGTDADGPALLITVDNTGVPASLRDEVIGRLQRRKGIRPERVALCSSHSHTAPCLSGNLPTLFGEPLPPEHQAHVDQYTRELVDALEKVALDALKDRRPCHVERGQGTAGFATNRRTKGGPVDHDVPILVISDRAGRLRAILANYACHCTTLGGETNQICGDWAGYAQEYIERDHPGALALISIGCGADSNPEPRTGLDLARRHGEEIARTVNETLEHNLTPVGGKLNCRAESIGLPFEALPTREQWEQLAKQGSYSGYYAQVNLAKLDRGETLPTRLPYYIQTWNFGDDFAMVFLAGEVVVDYSLRFKKEFDPARLWVTAYANDVPCYIPSERVLKEGGYEGGGAMIYYDKPAKLAPGLENKIVDTVHRLLPKAFVFDEKKAEAPPPLSPEASLAAIQTRKGLRVQLVAAEPLVVDPVAIDWAADGKLWVAEMRDYPTGMDGHWKAGSRIKFLDHRDRTGRYQRATVFLDGLPFVTGVTAWRKGVLICTAPDILYAEDTSGDGRADRVEKLFSGFFTDNYQARVNSLSLGLDNWIYGANGLLGGVIRGQTRSLSLAPAVSVEVDIRGRDFRMNPDTGAFEPVSGLTQQGRVRDDWGNWFGCDNSVLAWHYPLPDDRIRRNPHIVAPTPRVAIAEGPDPNLLHPISRTLERYNNPESANRVTSACGIGIYRDTLLPLEGDLFTCEPVHNLVHRLRLHPSGATFTAARDAGEEQSEFLASRDNWFRPVQVRTGPDGALWIVDMYRFVIEHPRWISPERLAKLEVRAGENQGRIYRIVPADGPTKLRPIRDLTRLSTRQLAAALDTPNGAERDRAHLELLWRADPSAAGVLKSLAQSAKLASVRLQALCVLDALNAVTVDLVQDRLHDPEPRVRANAIRMADRFAHRCDAENVALMRSLVRMTNDTDSRVAFQLALSLGEWDETEPKGGRPEAQAGKSVASPPASAFQPASALGTLATRHIHDPWIRAAILTSAVRHPECILRGVLSVPESRDREAMLNQLIATAAGASDEHILAGIVAAIGPVANTEIKSWQLTAIATLLDTLDRKKLSLNSLTKNESAEAQEAVSGLNIAFRRARAWATDSHDEEALAEPAIHLLGRQPGYEAADVELLVTLLDRPLPARAQSAVFAALERSHAVQVPDLLLSRWTHRPPSFRQAALQVLLGRNDWLAPVLAAVEEGVISRAEIPAAQRQRLLKSSNAALRQRAETLWAPLSSRAAMIARFQDATTISGDPTKGAVIFANLCATCHALHGQGHNVGPNLAPLADKSPSDFLTAILDPNAAVEPRFIAYNVETRDGRSLSGIVNAESATSLTLIQSGGTEEKILHNDITEIRASGLSLMPEGLEQNLSPRDLADLIAFLKKP